MKTHDLKCDAEFYTALDNGTKTFEVRKNDRGFLVGDNLRLMFPDGRALHFRITFILHGGYGLKLGHVAMAIVPYRVVENANAGTVIPGPKRAAIAGDGRAAGGRARAAALTPERRREIATDAARKRWAHTGG